jgi:hypothetical protein
MNVEGIFKFLFGLAIFVFCLMIVGIFLLILKIALMFTPELSILGLNISY